MDSKTRNVLGKISSNAPTRSLTKTVVDTSLEDAAKDALKDPAVKGVNKDRVRKMIDAGKFRTTEEVEDEAAIAEIDAHNTREVQGAIARGEIPDPANDPFVRERMWRAQNRDPNQMSSYQSLMAGIKASRGITPAQDYVLIQIVPRAEKPGAIIIPDSAKKKSLTMEAVVFRLGPDCVYELKEGDRVLVRVYDFEPIEQEKTLFMIGHEKDILGKML